jgi:predicted transposase YdaD
LGKIDGEKVFEELYRLAETNRDLTDRECVQLALLPLMGDKKGQIGRAQNAIDVARYIEPNEKRKSAIEMMVVIMSKAFTDEEQKEIMKGVSAVSNLFDLIYEEGSKKVRAEVRAETKEQMKLIFKLHARGCSPEEISKKVDMPIEEIRETVRDLES